MSNLKRNNELAEKEIDSLVGKKTLVGLMALFFAPFGVDRFLLKQKNSAKNIILYTVLFFVMMLVGGLGLFINIFAKNITIEVLSLLFIVTGLICLFIKMVMGLVRGIKLLIISEEKFKEQINNEYFLDGVKGNSGLALTLRRNVIFYKNHIDMFALIFAALAMIVFTLAVYVYTPLNNLLIQTRWPWAQGINDPEVPFTMIQFFAFLSSMLGALCLLNYRSNRKKIMAVGFYALSGVQLINDIYYLSDIYRHLGGNIILVDGSVYDRMSTSWETNAGIAFTIIHIVLLSISILILIFSPLIQKLTSKIKIGSASRQDRDIDETNSEIILEAENAKNEYGYNLDDIDDELYRKVLGDNYKEIVPNDEFEEIKVSGKSKKQKTYDIFARLGRIFGLVSLIGGVFTFGYLFTLAIVGIIFSKFGQKSYERKEEARLGFSLSVFGLCLNLIVLVIANYLLISNLF